jgi:hypothetical protein
MYSSAIIDLLEKTLFQIDWVPLIDWAFDNVWIPMIHALVLVALAYVKKYANFAKVQAREKVESEQFSRFIVQSIEEGEESLEAFLWNLEKKGESEESRKNITKVIKKYLDDRAKARGIDTWFDTEVQKRVQEKKNVSPSNT